LRHIREPARYRGAEALPLKKHGGCRIVTLALAPLSVGTAFTSWQPDPAGLAVAGALALGYLLLVRRARILGHHWPLARTLTFLIAGVGTLLIATAGSFGVYADQLFWVYAVQMLLLLLIAPVFLAFGRPLTLLRLQAAGTPAREASPWLTRLSHPLIGPALVPVCTVLVFFTGLFNASLRSSAVAAAVHLGLLLAGFIFALPLLGEGAPPASIAIAAAVFVGFLELLADALPGFAIRMNGSLLTPWFANLHRGWGPTPINDQNFGGSILWGVAELVDLPFLAFMVVQWVRADARETVEVDRRLDAIAMKEAPTGEPLASETPWWERDASVFGARAGQFRRKPPDHS
jgi:putative membrane protein